MSNTPTLENTVFYSVLYKTQRWLPSLLGSINRYLPQSRFYLFDNNPLPGEPDYQDHIIPDSNFYTSLKVIQAALYEKVVVVPVEVRQAACEAGNRCSHGDSMDYAMQYFRQKTSFRYAVHLDPDTIVTGVEWFNSLVEAMTEGYHLAAVHTYPNGLAHPSGTIWDLNVDHESCTSGVFPESYPFNREIWETIRWSPDQGSRLGESYRVTIGPLALPGMFTYLKKTPPYLDVARRPSWVGLCNGTYKPLPQPTDFTHFWYGTEGRYVESNVRKFLEMFGQPFPEVEEYRALYS